MASTFKWSNCGRKDLKEGREEWRWVLCNEMSTTKGFRIGKTRRANEEKHVLQGASAKFDVGSDKI